MMNDEFQDRLKFLGGHKDSLVDGPPGGMPFEFSASHT
jgi:hypothetical protein